jgi:hypothetical protein
MAPARESGRASRENHRMHNLLPSPRARAAVAAFAIPLFVSACSGGGGGGPTPNASHTIQSVATATRAAGSGKATGTASTGTAQGPVESVWVAPKDPKADDNGHATFAVFLGGKPAGNTEFIWIGNVLWIGRVVRPAPSTKLTGLETVLLRAPADPKFSPYSMTYLNSFAAAFSPARLAQTLASLSNNVSSRPGNTVGTNTTEYYTVKPLQYFGPWAQVSVSLWADSSDRVVRVRLSSPSGVLNYTVTGYTSQPDVAPPPKSQSVTPTTLPPPKPSGAFAVAASGQTGRVNWSLMRAPGTRGTECWRWAATPSATIVNANADGTRCYLAQQPGDSASDATAFVVQTKAPGPYAALAVRLPEAPTKATLGFAGGKMQALTPNGKILVWVGPGAPLPAYLGLTFANGSKVDCFAGTLISVDDLDTTTDGDVANTTWSC